MGGVEGIRFIPLPPSGNPATNDLVNQLMSGTVLRGRIATDGALLSLTVAGQQIPLPEAVNLPPGTPVEVQFLKQAESATPRLQLRVNHAPAEQMPAPLNAPATTAARAPELPAALAPLIKPEQAAILLPKLAAIPPRALEALLSIFVARSDAGRALARLTSLTPGDTALPADVRAAIESVAQTMDAETPAEFRRAIEVARELIGAGRHAAMSHGEPGVQEPTVSDDVTRLRDLLGSRGGEVARAADAVSERVANTILQNVRSFDAPYQFLAIPFAPGTGIEHAQVHLVGRDGRAAQAPNRNAQTVVLDLELSKLGPLWITVQAVGAACSCVVRSVSDAARTAIQAAAPALETALRDAGFGAAQVRAEPWDGDRVRAAAGLFTATALFEAEA